LAAAVVVVSLLVVALVLHLRHHFRLLQQGVAAMAAPLVPMPN
jgi:hypothetical protein